MTLTTPRIVVLTRRFMLFPRCELPMLVLSPLIIDILRTMSAFLLARCATRGCSKELGFLQLCSTEISFLQLRVTGLPPRFVAHQLHETTHQILARPSFE